MPLRIIAMMLLSTLKATWNLWQKMPDRPLFRGLCYKWDYVGSCRITNKITGMGVTKATFDLNYLTHDGKGPSSEAWSKP